MIELYFINNNGVKKGFLRNLKGVGEPTPSFLSTLRSVKDNTIQEEKLNKKVGRGRYAIEKKYLIPFILMACFCGTCGETTSFRRWKKGTLYSDKGVLECMTCKFVKYI